MAAAVSAAPAAADAALPQPLPVPAFQPRVGGGGGASTSVAALFGDDSDDLQPLWFSKDAFTGAAFSSEAYIADLRRYVPLDTLHTELKSHLAALKSELVELINRDYTDFVNLSTKLVDVDGAVLRMRMPLSELRTKLQAMREAVAAALEALQGGLQRRAEASAARATLELLLDTSHVLSKVEKLLQELNSKLADEGRPPGVSMPATRTVGAPNGHAAGLEANGDIQIATAAMEDEEQRSRQLERIASEMNRLKFYVARAQAGIPDQSAIVMCDMHCIYNVSQGLPFVQSMQKRMSAATSVLAAQLLHTFEWGLEQRDEAVLHHCLRAYVALDDTAGAEEAFRVSLVAKRVALVLPQNTIKNAVPGGNLLAPVYRELEQHVESDLQFLIRLASARETPDNDLANSGLHAFEFVSNSVLREVHAALHRTMPSAFSPGKPQEFLANYKATLAFLSFLEGYCPTQASVLAFRQHAATVEFLQHWNLGVYFFTRFQEIAGPLDAALAATTAAAAPAEKGRDGLPPLTLNASSVLWESLLRCWHPDIYLSSLADKFLRLSLQLLSRYTLWLSTGLAARKAGAPHSGGGGEWALVASAEDFVLVRHDLELLAELVDGPELSARLPQLLGQAVPLEVKDAARALLVGAAQGLLQLIGLVMDVLTDVVADKCIDVLRSIKGITASYRMTNRPMPERHSHYVVTILQPLRVFLDGGQASYLTERAWQQLIKLLVERVTARFDEMARDVVTMAIRTETSLARLAGRGKKAGADTGAISDADRITAQLFFDVQEYGRQIARLGVQAADFDSYNSLWQRVAPPDRQAIDI